MHQLGSAVLQGQSVAVVLVQALQHPDAIRVELEVRTVEDPERAQLVTQYALADRKLGGVGAVEAVDAVRSYDAGLQAAARFEALLLAYDCNACAKETVVFERTYLKKAVYTFLRVILRLIVKNSRFQNTTPRDSSQTSHHVSACTLVLPCHVERLVDDLMLDG